MNFSVLSRGEWFVFIIPAVMSFVPIVDIWTKFSIKFISLLRLKGEREDATAFVTGCVMFINIMAAAADILHMALLQHSVANEQRGRAIIAGLCSQQRDSRIRFRHQRGRGD